jgi:hypothetical protein
MRGTLLLLPLATLLLPLSTEAKVPAGTGITASKTAAGHLTSTSAWTIAKSPDPASQMVEAGKSATVHWTITTTKSASGTIGAYLDGQICVTNTGSRATQGLAIHDQVTKSASTTVLNTVAVDVSAKPQLNPGEAHCYPYTITIPAASIVPGAIYKDTAHVTITNQSCCPGTPNGPSPSATAALPTSTIPIDASITVTDTNGQSLSFSSGGSQVYDQAFDCPGTPGDHSLDNTATIQSTGQTTSAQATVHCAVYPQSNALAQPLLDELGTFGTNCVSIFLDTVKAECGGCNDDCCGVNECCHEEDHHQGLARTQKLKDGSIYFFLSHSGVECSIFPPYTCETGRLMQFRYAGAVDDEHVDGQGVTAPMEERIVLATEQHPSAISFLPDVNQQDSGYLFVAKEYDEQAVTVYYWQPGSDLEAIGNLTPGLPKPSHILIDRIGDYYYLVVLDNTPITFDNETYRLGTGFKAYYKDLFPSGAQGAMDISAFQVLPYFKFAGDFTGDLGSQAQLIRDTDSTNPWHVLVYNSPDTSGFGDDFVHVFDIQFDAPGGNVTALTESFPCPPIPFSTPAGVIYLYCDPPPPFHFFLPEGQTSFTNTGTHYVEPDGRLLISSSARWSEDEGNSFSYESRVDECVPSQ